MWGDVGRCGEVWGDVWGGVGRCGEMWGAHQLLEFVEQDEAVLGAHEQESRGVAVADRAARLGLGSGSGLGFGFG